MSHPSELFVGLDVHAESIVIALAEPGRDGEVRLHSTISGDLHSLERTMRKLAATGRNLRVVYEAGPCGFVVARRLAKMNMECKVVAPSLTPRGSGDKIKTDRRDAKMLARLHRAGELTAVNVPDERDEAVRDLCRARTDAVQDQRSSRYQLKALLLRHGYRYAQKTSWTVAHMRYLRELVLPLPCTRVVLEEYILAVEAATERIERIEKHMQDQLAAWHMAPVVKALMGFKGFQTVAAMIVVSEIGNIHRFNHPRQLMAYLGLVPSECSSGESRNQGSITKTGNGHLRWIMVECAQHYRLEPKVSKELTTRQELIDKKDRHTVAEISWRCQNRLYQKGRKLSGRGKLRQKVQTALARELTAFVWELMWEIGAKPGEESSPSEVRRQRDVRRAAAADRASERSASAPGKAMEGKRIRTTHEESEYGDPSTKPVNPSRKSRDYTLTTKFADTGKQRRL
jgi:transposase